VLLLYTRRVTPPNPPFKTQIRPYGKAAIDEAARLILAGLPVAMPTETVYGLAADATNPEAVARIYDAKGRPGFNPLIVHVADLAQAERIGAFSHAARALAEAYWPGALTLVVPRTPNSRVADIATAGLPTVALRSPRHPAMQDLLRATGKPLAAPSANASGMISPTSADHVVKSLDGRIPLVVDAGPTEHGIESTIVAVTDDTVILLRPGPIEFGELTALVTLAQGEAPAEVQAPGQLKSHYAPSKPLRLDAEAAADGEYLIGFGPVDGDFNLSARGDMVEAAAKLFHALHQADASPKSTIAVAPVPGTGLGVAINDRLRRAANPREQC
jgi:L-threonylcarbamoyladenylate synthase